jgi:hypothetical protein
MRMLLLAVLLLPVVMSAQINRSARELASEAAQEYLVKKLFKDKPYQPLSFSDVRAWDNTRSDITWTIDHKFEIEEPEMVNGRKVLVRKPYHFLFYLDRRMKVLRAEGSPVAE